MNIVGLQWDIAWKDRLENYQRVEALLEASPPPVGSLVVLPEMFATGYSFDLPSVCENADDSPTLRFLETTAKARNIFLLGGLALWSPTGNFGFNALAVASPDGNCHVCYRKLHPFGFVGEDKKFSPGDSISLLSFGPIRIAPFICYDLRFPEIFREAVDQEAHLFIVPANWPAARSEHWRALLITRAIENQAYVLGVNRSGEDPNAPYAGQSILVDPKGKVVEELGPEPGSLAGRIDLEALLKYRESFPALQDRRYRTTRGATPRTESREVRSPTSG